MRRSASLVLGLFAGAAFLSACRDATVAPIDPSPVDLSVPAITYAELEAEARGITHWVTIDPRRDNVYGDGINAIRIPAGAICDPETTAYGPAYWDAPCTPATAPIAVPITVSALGGGIVVHVGRDMRFAPTADPAKQVTLVVDATRITGSVTPGWNIVWLPSDAAVFVDEAESDPSLATSQRADGRLVRRLKHFSGYYAHLGFNSPECDPDVDAGCIPR